MRQAWGFVWNDGTIEDGGSGNFDVRKEGNEYYIDSSVFSTFRPALVIYPFYFFDSNATAKWDEWWDTGTVRVTTDGQCSFSFTAFSPDV